MKVIFLDIDGVMNTDFSESYVKADNGWTYIGIDNSKVKELKRIVDTTGAEIVLSSDWRYAFEVGAYKQEVHTCKYLNNKLRKQGLKIYDKTPDIAKFERGLEISTWLDKHPEVTDYVILDDHSFAITGKYYEVDEKLRSHFILTTGKVADGGLTPEVADIAIEILNGERVGPVSWWKLREKNEA